MEMVLSTSKRTLEGSEKASGRDGATGPDVTNMEISQKDDGEVGVSHWCKLWSRSIYCTHI